MKAKAIVSTLFIAALFSCENAIDKATDPVIETTQAKSVAATTCYVKASILERGSYEVIEGGFVYSTSSSFGIENGTKITLSADSLKADTFSASFSFGSAYYHPSQVFYVRAYLVNKKGVVYGLPLSFRGLMLTMSSVQPISGKTGDKITITGENFIPTLTGNVVKFNSTTAKIVEATATRLVVEVPANITWEYSYDPTVKLYVTVGGQTLSSNFTLLPIFTSFSPTSGTFGTLITILGDNINSSGLTVKCGDINASINSVTNRSLVIYVPGNMTLSKFPIKLIKNGIETVLPTEFTMNPINITSVSPTIGYPGTVITFTGTSLNPAYGANQVKIGGVLTSSGYVNQNSFSVTVPYSMTEGLKTIEASNGVSNVVLPGAFTVVVPKVSGFTPASGYYGNEITVTGENFPGNLSAYIGNSGCELVTVNSTTLKVKVPTGTAPGASKIKLMINNVVVYESDFNVLSPVLTSFLPDSGTPGTEVILTGNGFGNYVASVRFGTVYTNVLSTTPTQIKVVVPSNAGDGAMKISVVVGSATIISTTDFTIKR